jgi:hypothetical protein
MMPPRLKEALGYCVSIDIPFTASYNRRMRPLPPPPQIPDGNNASTVIACIMSGMSGLIVGLAAATVMYRFFQMSCP